MQLGLYISFSLNINKIPRLSPDQINSMTFQVSGSPDSTLTVHYPLCARTWIITVARIL